MAVNTEGVQRFPNSPLKFSVRAERSAAGAESKRANYLMVSRSYFDSASLRSIRTVLLAIFNKLLMRRTDTEGGLVLLVELGEQAGFPGQILLHGFPVAGVAVVNEEKIVDGLGIRGAAG